MPIWSKHTTRTTHAAWRGGQRAARTGFICLMLVGFVCPGVPGFIDPKFTPADLVRQSDLILAGSLRPGAAPDVWTVGEVEVLKGQHAGALTLSLASFTSSQADAARDLLRHNGGAPIIAFAATQKAKRAFLHIADQWLVASVAEESPWMIESFDPKMSGVYAGGTDMLIRMSQHLVAHPKAKVPVSVGTCWIPTRCNIAQVAGVISGLATVELPDGRKTYLFAASDQGDRLFCPRNNEEAFDEVTAARQLTSRSVKFAWVDMTGDGRLDLCSWDGRAIRLWELREDGTFGPVGAASYELTAECLGLAPCSKRPGGAAAVLVSTSSQPFLLSLGDARTWQKTALPPVAADASTGEPAAACVAADLDNDGLWDALQPRTRGSLLWRGSQDGFEAPVVLDVHSPGQPCHHTLGDFNQDGYLDLFVAGPEGNELWENDGHGGFAGMGHRAGSLSYKAPAGASGCLATDLNHDGLTDLCLLYPDGSFMYHFNRGFRCLGEEGGLRLTDVENAGLEAVGQRACVAADFNLDGSLDLAVAFMDGQLCCYYNELFNRPGLRIGLAAGIPGPITVSLWQGADSPICVGARSVAGPAQWAYLPLPDAGEYFLKWGQPGRLDSTKRVTLPEQPPPEGAEIILGD